MPNLPTYNDIMSHPNKKLKSRRSYGKSQGTVDDPQDQRKRHWLESWARHAERNTDRRSDHIEITGVQPASACLSHGHLRLKSDENQVRKMLLLIAQTRNSGTHLLAAAISTIN